MSLRVRFDPEYVGEQIGQLCFEENRNVQELDLYLAGAAYAVCLSLGKEKPWKQKDFVNIGLSIVRSGTKRFLDLTEKNILVNSVPQENDMKYMKNYVGK
ncbi:hypothetical protein WSS15_31800 [Acetobacter pasteurianus]|uniref:Uncharacterized protein n=5 Tax=Acetobacter TaxID=434 RepID=A0A1Y0V1B6_9PROT|nr:MULTISPECIES: hypothetical protein [Acetobacter]GCD76317.1 hypothetical protein NBRC3299_2609 [Acetobacter pasteurianus NBRC 3299]ANA15127.1 hypothetical protein WG31_13360 [Acetobacter oryzifermentans]ARW11970.1 hypothetical protein S101447_02933 [Acetobacter ascendens]ARW49015.1 hypothetical protein S1001342_02725 [Acetobacter pasteurianus subsp. pasteurianus]ATI13498.1 hypothetical protein CPF11_13435 [Acetobacter pomorum]